MNNRDIKLTICYGNPRIKEIIVNDDGWLCVTIHERVIIESEDEGIDMSRSATDVSISNKKFKIRIESNRMDFQRATLFCRADDIRILIPKKTKL